MRKKRKYRRTTRDLSLPMWLKLRMNNELKNQVEWMMIWAEKCNADMVSQSVTISRWKITLEVKRRYDRKQ